MTLTTDPFHVMESIKSTQVVGEVSSNTTDANNGNHINFVSLEVLDRHSQDSSSPLSHSYVGGRRLRTPR